jgi:hypothetical protein
MPLLKYFISVGLLLTFALYRWSEYLEPSAPTRAESVSAKPPAMGGEAFRPTPAPIVVEAAEIPPPIETPPAVEATKATGQTKAARREPKTRKTRLTARRPEESRANIANDAAPRLFSLFN